MSKQRFRRVHSGAVVSRTLGKWRHYRLFLFMVAEWQSANPRLDSGAARPFARYRLARADIVDTMQLGTTRHIPTAAAYAVQTRAHQRTRLRTHKHARTRTAVRKRAKKKQESCDFPGPPSSRIGGHSLRQHSIARRV